MAATFETSVGFDLPGGGRLEVGALLHATWRRAEGDGWDSPRVPAGWEMDGAEPSAATWHHADGDCTEIGTPRGSFAWHWLDRFLERNWPAAEQEAALREAAGAGPDREDYLRDRADAMHSAGEI